MTIKIKNIISITEARSSIFDIAEKIQKHGNHYLFTENGKAKMAVMSAEEYESLMEDLEILSDPKIMANIKEAEEQLKRGEYITLDELMKEYGYTDADLQPTCLREKPKKPYITKIINKSIKKPGSKKNAR